MSFGNSILEGFWEGLGRVLGDQNLGLETGNLPNEVGNHPKINIKLKLRKIAKKVRNLEPGLSSARRMAPRSPYVHDDVLVPLYSKMSAACRREANFRFLA